MPTPKAKSVKSKPIRPSKSNCTCGETEKVILLVGCTQHGKSSVIRAILDSGEGGTAAGDTVGIGFGSRSKTKEAKSYTAVLQINKHGLKDDAGNERTINDFEDDPEGLEEVFSLEPFVIPMDRHVHLRIIDTPGLNDSDNMAAEERQAKGSGSGSATLMKTVDEQHKFAVFSKIAEEGKLQAICIVLSIEDTLGKGVRGVLNEYLDLFKACRLSAPIYFLENSPTCEITQHFAAKALSKLAKEIAMEEPHLVMQLNYPKSASHTLWDGDLSRVARFEVLSLETEQMELRAEIEGLQYGKKPIKSREEQEWKDLQDAERRHDALDTTEEVELNRRREYRGSKFFSTSEAYFSITADVPIRRYSQSHCNDSTWSYLPKQSDVYGEKSMTARLCGNGWNESITGTIILYGWRKEKQVSQLEILQREVEGARSDWSKSWNKIKAIDKEVEEKANAIISKDARIAEVKAEQLCWHGEHISMSKIKDRGPYFGCPSIFGYAYGHDSTFKAPISRLRNLDLGSAASMKIVMDGWIAAYIAQVTLCKHMISTMADQLIEAAQYRKGLQVQKEHLEDAVNRVEALVSTSLEESWAPVVQSFRKPSFDQKARDGVLNDFWAKLRSARTAAGRFVSMSYARQGFMMSNRVGLFKSTHEDLQPLFDGLDDLMEKWQEELKDKEALVAAAKLCKETIDVDCLPLGVVSVLRRHAKEAKDRWEALLFEYKATYVCDPSGWDRVRMYVLS